MIQSVHLEMFPTIDDLPNDRTLMLCMDVVMAICKTSLAIRKDAGVKVRIPISTLTIYSDGRYNLEDFLDIIRDEINVRQIVCKDISEVANKQLLINFKACGAKFKSKISTLMALAKAGEWKNLDNGSVMIGDTMLSEDECSIVYVIDNTHQGLRKCDNMEIFVSLDLMITEDLRLDGLSRDIVRFIQQDRKSMQLEMAAKISVALLRSDIVNSIANNVILLDYLSSQVLANDVTFVDQTDDIFLWFQHELDGALINIGIKII